MKSKISSSLHSRSVITKLALRNLIQHKSKTIIVALIMSVSVFVLIIGLTTINTIEAGINKAFIEYFTGDVFIRADADYKYSLMGIQSPGGMDENPVIPEYNKIAEYVRSHPAVKSSTPYITGPVMLGFEEQGNEDGRGISFVFGIDGNTYADSFELVISEGTGIQPGQRGLVLAQNNKEDLEQFLEREVKVGDLITLYGFGGGGFSIREVPIVGIYEFLQGRDSVNYIGFIDGDTFKDIKGLYYANEPLNIADYQVDLLDFDLSDDSFFDDFFSENVEVDFESTLSSDLNLEIDREKENEQLIFDEIWEFIVIRLKDQNNSRSFIRDVNKWLSEEGIAASAGTWQEAAYPLSTMADAIRIIFMIVVGIVFCVAIMIVINTLVVSVLERTPEIGTMRALGAQKGFVRHLFNYEIILLSFFSGLIGLILALITIFVIKICQIEATNTLLFVLFSGNYLNPVMSFWAVVGPFITIMLAGIVANFYPVILASNVAPVVAMREK